MEDRDTFGSSEVLAYTMYRDTEGASHKRRRAWAKH